MAARVDRLAAARPQRAARGRPVIGILLLVLLLPLILACEQDPRELGERIYHSGTGLDGRLAYQQGPGWLRHTRHGCAVCHGPAGQGKVVRAGEVTGAAPAVTADALRARGYDATSLRRVIRDGVSPEGRALHYYMPRWQLQEPEMQALLDYLGRL